MGFQWDLRVVLNGTCVGPEGGFKWDLRVGLNGTWGWGLNGT